MWLAIAAGGVAGTFARLGVQSGLQRWAAAQTFPLGTLLVNVSGSLLIGFVFRWGSDAGHLPPALRAGLMVGFCGAYTTFSAYSLETVRLVQDGALGRAAVYALGSVVLSVAGTFAGIAVADRIL